MMPVYSIFMQPKKENTCSTERIELSFIELDKLFILFNINPFSFSFLGSKSNALHRFSAVDEISRTFVLACGSLV